MATKKLSKIEAPIDQRETFVSLQSNMSDTDAVTMEQKLRTLYQIQQADTKIDKIYLLRGELPLEVQDLEDEIEGLKTRISKLQAEISELGKSNADNKHKLEESKNEIAKYEEQNLTERLQRTVQEQRQLNSDVQKVDSAIDVKQGEEEDIPVPPLPKARIDSKISDLQPISEEVASTNVDYNNKLKLLLYTSLE